MEDQDELNEDTQRGKFLTFLLEDEVFGIEIKYVTEIIGIQPITEVPDVPEYVKGIINLRGKIVPVIDMRVKFGKEPAEYNDRTCIVVTEGEETVVGLIVDNVADVLTIADENIVPPPDYHNDSQKRYIKGIGKCGNDIKLLIDCEMLMKGE